MKTILITGTSSGVGATIAYDYIEKGWNVIGFARSESLFNYSNYKHYQVDISNLDMVYKAFEQIADTKIDILVNG
jgi:short-subunit dehydrogenase